MICIDKQNGLQTKFQLKAIALTCRDIVKEIYLVLVVDSKVHENENERKKNLLGYDYKVYALTKTHKQNKTQQTK